MQTLTAKDLDNSRKRYLSNLKKLDAKLALYPELVRAGRRFVTLADAESDCPDSFDDALTVLREVLAKAEAIERGSE